MNNNSIPLILYRAEPAIRTRERFGTRCDPLVQYKKVSDLVMGGR